MRSDRRPFSLWPASSARRREQERVDCLAVRNRFGMPALHGVDAPEFHASFMRDARVGDLFLAACPFDVARLVMSVVVDSFKRQPGRTRTNVLAERCEGSPPSFADAYASAAVVLERSILWITAALNHLAPSAVFGGSALAVRLSSGLASARPRRRSSQRPNKHRTFDTTYAPATQVAQVAVSSRLLKQHDPVTNLCSTRNRTQQVRSTSGHFTSNSTGERDV
jgi:hypothetical protein